MLFLRNTNSAFLNDRELMLTALQHDPQETLESLQETNSTLLNDPEVMSKVIDLCPIDIFSLQPAKSKFSRNRTFLLALLEKDTDKALPFADESMKKDPVFKRAVINRSIGQAYKYGYIGIFGVIGYSLLKAVQWIKNLLLRPFKQHRPKKGH
jgi:hypothetical protein